jgi:hypothetical protein
MIPSRTLGRTGERVSAIGIGGYHLGKPYLEESESIRIVRTAIDSGVTFLDNSWDYYDGQSELRMGETNPDELGDMHFPRSVLSAPLGFLDGEDAVERVFAGAGKSQSERTAQERELKLVTADETLADLDQRDRAEHVNSNEQGDGPRDQPEYQSDSAEELQEGDGWTDDPREGHPHLAECADHAGQAEDEELLGAMGDENATKHDTQNRECRVQALRQEHRGRGVRHK